MLDYISLPAPTIVPRADAVFITVTNVDDLGAWLVARGGKIHVTPAYDGLELWTLVTRTPKGRDGTSVEVRVSVPVPAREIVLANILAAVVSR
ncbi:hypothetical protein [Streptomyces sp. KL116D]|uniref:hypothetical protein n=1 Tax=Streptomyces sp. KL116D TaxID=3045152 RepID=UPI00355683C0